MINKYAKTLLSTSAFSLPVSVILFFEGQFPLTCVEYETKGEAMQRHKNSKCRILALAISSTQPRRVLILADTKFNSDSCLGLVKILASRGITMHIKNLTSPQVAYERYIVRPA